MIEFFLDNVQVYPSEGQTISLQDYNTLCEASNGKGAYTYDIDFDLNVKANATAFNWLAKLNTGNIPTGRRAVMYVDGVKIFEGTESLLSVTGMTAKIQVLCGNSEVNFRGNDTRIADLDLPVIPEYTETSAKATWSKDLVNGTDHVIFVPVMTTLDHFPYEADESKFANFIDRNSVWNEGGPNLKSGTPLIPQVSLVWAVECVIEAVGFTLEYNELRFLSYSKNMVIIHGYTDRRLSRILPNWTVSEFLSEVQKLFNVVFVFNEDKSASIYKVGEFYKNIAGLRNIDYNNVVDRRTSFERNFEHQEDYLYNYERISYNLPSSYYYNRAALQEDLKKLCSVSDVNGFSALTSSSILKADNYNLPVIYKETNSNTSWIISTKSPTDTIYHMERVDQFGMFVSDDAEDNATETTMKIVPAEIFCLDIHPLNSNGHYYNMGAGVAYARNGDVVAEVNDSSTGLQDWIDGEIPTEISTSENQLFVAQVDPEAHVLWSHQGSSNLDIYNGAYFPQTYVTRYMSGYVHAAGAQRYNQIFDFGAYNAEKVNAQVMDFSVRANDVYNKQAVVDEDNVFVLKFFCKKRINVNDIFVFDNKKFLCVYNEYTIENGHLSPIVKGTFVPLVSTVDVSQKEDNSVNAWYKVDIPPYQVGNNQPAAQWIEYDGLQGYKCFKSRNLGMAETAFWIRITFKDYKNFKFYVDSYAESGYDYLVVYDKDIDKGYDIDAAVSKNDSGVIAATDDWQKPATSISNFKEVVIANDGEEHFVWIAFRKDRTTDKNDDCGYIAIPM